MSTKKSKKPAAKRVSSKILYLHVETATKSWFSGVTRTLDKKEVGHVSQSMVAERILKNLKKNPRLLKEALK